jgi:hypothetical protein
MKISELLGYKLNETSSDGTTTAANVGVGVVSQNKAPKPTKGLKPNALDDEKHGLMTGGSIKRI